MLTLLPAILLLGGCTQINQTKSNGNRLTVAATIFPLYDIARQIGGDKIDVKLILPPGASPHTFEVSPGQIRELQTTKLILAVGQGADDWTNNLGEAIGAKIATVEKNIELKPFEHQEHEHHEEDHDDDDDEEENDEHQHGQFDPHYWLSPANAKIIAQNITDELSELDPANQSDYQNNAEKFITELANKDQEWHNKIGTLENKNLVVFHDAWGYFADYFGLDIVATFEPFPGKSPSPKYLADLENEVKAKNIKALFVEPQLSQEAINTMAKDLNVEVKVLDPLGGADERNSYLKLIDYNINNIANTLK